MVYGKGGERMLTVLAVLSGIVTATVLALVIDPHVEIHIVRKKGR